MNSYDHLTSHTVIPAPSAMIETLRAIGYHLETAIADIVDNSIAAQASRIKRRSVNRVNEKSFF